MKIDKQLIKMSYDRDADMLHIVDTVDSAPEQEDNYIYATIEDVARIKSTMIMVDTTNIPATLKTILREKFSSDTTL